MKKIRIILALGFFLSLAESANGQMPASTPAATSSSTSPAPATPNLPTTASSGTSIQAQAQQAQSANNSSSTLGMIGMGISAGVAVMHYKPCFCDPLFWAGVAGVGISAMIMSNANTAASGAADTAAQVTNPTPQQPNAPPTNTTTPTTTMSPSGVQAMNSLAAQGVKINSDNGNVSLPNGQTVSGSQLAAGDFSGTGMSAADQASAKSALAGIIKEAKVAASEQAADGALLSAGSDGLGGTGGSPLNLGSERSPASTLSKSGVKRDAASAVAGMKKVVDGGRDAIGVSSDNLFTMVGNRYKVQGNSGGFVAK